MNLRPLPPRAEGSSLHRLEGTRFRAVDVGRSAAHALAARPGRSLLTASGTVLGIAALVATISLTATARQQIADAFAALQQDELGARSVPNTSEPSAIAFEGAPLERLRRRPDVHRAGILHAFESPVNVALTPHAEGRWVVPVAVDEHLMEVIAPSDAFGRITTSRWGEGGLVLLARPVADALGLSAPAPGQAILVKGQPLALGGIFEDVAVRNELLLSVVVDPQTAANLDLGPIDTLTVYSVPGGATRLAQDLPALLAPFEPGTVQVTQLPAPERLRQEVDSSVGQLLLLLAVVALGIGGLGIANASLIAVLEQAGEIGLRRALGARRRHIALQTVAESGLLGLGGAVAGVWLGVAITVFASLALRWEPSLDLRPIWLGPLAGLGVGVIAGLYPAIRAASLQPADVLRR